MAMEKKHDEGHKKKCAVLYLVVTVTFLRIENMEEVRKLEV